MSEVMVIVLVLTPLSVSVLIAFVLVARLQTDVSELHGRFQRLARSLSTMRSQSDQAVADIRKLPSRIKATRQYIMSLLEKNVSAQKAAAAKAAREAQRESLEASRPSKAAATTSGKTVASR